MSLYAEITPGHERILLMAGGPAEEAATSARYLETLTPLFSKSDPPGALSTAATWPAVVQLEATFGAHLLKGPGLQAWIAETAAQRLAAEAGENPLTYTPPAELTPYPWQVAGARMIADTGGALITDEPGTGKTITAILGLVEWSQTRTTADSPPPLWSQPVLVVCPNSVIDAWVAAWTTWAPHVRAVAWRGPAKKRAALVGTADVYVASYETVRQDAGVARAVAPLRRLDLQHLVVDECHLIKNPRAERSRAVHRLATAAKRAGGVVVAMSGTPITHHPGDLWSSLVAVDHDAWPSKERWVKRYCVTIEGDYREEILGLERATEPELRLAMLGQMRRVAKADVLTQLPPKVYTVRTVDLPREWRKAYDDFESEMRAELPAGEGETGAELSVMDALTKVGMLYTLSCAAADVEVTFGPDVDDESGEPKRHVHLELKAPSWKVDELLAILDERREARTDAAGVRRPEQVVVFAQSRQLIALAGAAVAEAGYRVGYVWGDQKAAERTGNVEAFQAGDLDVICVTTGAGGTGLTLTAARTVVFLQRPWSLVDAVQAEDRCHRIGSEIHDSIEVIDVVARDTVDDRVRTVLRQRAGQLADLVRDPRIVAELLGGSSTTIPELTERQAS